LSQSTIKGQLIFSSNDNVSQYESPIVDLGCLNQLRKSFQLDETWSYGLYSSWGWVPDQGYLKVICNFKVANSTLVVPYIATFHLTGRPNENLRNTTDQDINPNCSSPTPQATSSEVGLTCSGNLYKTKVLQYARQQGKSRTEAITPSIVSSTNDFVIYPNPAANNVSIRLKKGITYPEIKVLIFDMTGRNVFQQTFKNIQSTLEIKNLSSLNKGTYRVLLLNKGEAIYSSKFIKI